MLGDNQLDACEAQLRSFRLVNGQHLETLQEILRKYETLVEDYRMLKSDYEEEKENREKYKRQARGQDRNPFVLVLVDGEGYIFKEHLIKNGREGGVSAAQLLSTEIRESLRKLGHLDHCRMVVRVYCNLAAVSNALARAGMVGHHARAAAPVAAAFTGTKEHFDFVDVGDHPGATIAKVEETFRLFADSSQCKHIFFAGCHETRYIPLLTPHLGKSDKVTLIRAPDQQQEFRSLGLAIENFSSVFRDSPLPGWVPGATSIKGAATKKGAQEPMAPPPIPAAQPEPVSKTNYEPAASLGGPSAHTSVNGDISESGKTICTHYTKKGWCKFGNSCKFEHPRKGKANKDNAFSDDWGNNNVVSTPEPSLADDWGASSKKSQSNFADDWGQPPKIKKNSPSHSMFTDDWRKHAKPSGSGFAEDWGNGPQQNSRTGSVSNQSAARSQKPGSVSELSVGSRNQEELRPNPADSLRSLWASDAPEPPRPKEATDPQDRSLGPRKFTSAFTTAADLPRPTPETEGLIPVNKYGDRLDFYLSRPTQEEYNAYNTMAKEPGRKPCNDYQLKGHCQNLANGRDCEYDHNPLSPELFHVLKVIVQGYPCPKGGKCRRSDCFNGHVCQRPGCRGMYPCRFKNDYRAHNLDPKATEWVPAIDLEERESDDSASVTMGSTVPVPEPKVSTVVPDPTADAEEWHPESAAWNPDAVDWKRAPSWNPVTAQPAVADWNPSPTAWNPDRVDRSDIDSDSDSVAPQPEKEVLDLGAEDATAGGIFSSKTRDGRLDSVVQTGDLSVKADVQANGSKLDVPSKVGEQSPPQPERDLLDDWGSPPPGIENPTTASETGNFDDDWGNAPAGVDNPDVADEPVDFADDWGPAPSHRPKPKQFNARQNNHNQFQNGGEASQGAVVW